MRCARCSSAVRVAGCGFVAAETLLCAERDGPVDEDDGCTFGSPGVPSRGVRGWDVDGIASQKPQLQASRDEL